MSDPLPPLPDPHPLNGSNALDLQHLSSTVAIAATVTNPSPASASASAAATTTTAPKRQRRPSVRLGDIGEQPAASDPFLHRRPKPSPVFKPPPPSTSNLQTLASSIRSRNPKFPKRHRNPRSSWSHPKPDEDEEEDEGFRSEFDDLRRVSAAAAIVGEDDSPDPPPTTADTGDWNEDEDDHNENLGMDEDVGVRSWLNRLGLGRYAPVFEIHEVDDEVLPLLTLEDLKDMGITAVGSRRKMYCAIQKLKKNFG